MRSALIRSVFALLLAGALIGGAGPTRGAAAEVVRAPDIVLAGELTGADNRTYVAAPFQVPAGVHRVTVEFAYTGREDRTTIDLGLFDPYGFRGWSGGNKSRFTLSATDATPSYLPGPLPPGEWRLQLGVPNIRSKARSTWTAKVWFERSADAPVAPAPIRAGAGWYRGDFHAHSGHSDGTCLSRKGASVPCPVFRLLEAGVARKLDFIALTDHNTTSHFQSIGELAPWFDDLLVLLGMEMTTFQGHLNLFAPRGFVDFRLGSAEVPDMDALLAAAGARSGLVAVNHPALPSGELCMGCGWTASIDWSRVDAVEVLNGGAITAMGGAAQSPLSGIPFWEALLTRGYRITAIGGSDSHEPDRAADKPGALGRPATVVYAGELSQTAILEGVKRGRVYIDVEGAGAVLTFDLAARGRTYGMGDALCPARGDRLRITAGAGAIPDAVVEIVASPNLKAGGIVAKGAGRFELTADGAPGWVRANVRGATNGRLMAVGNPVYLLAKGC